MTTLTLIHVLLSLAAIAAGIGMARDLLKGQLDGVWIKAFQATILLTLLTSFLFPIQGPTPGLSIAILSLFIFVPMAIFLRNPASRSRRIHIATAIAALLLFYFDCLVLVVQAYLKIPALHEMAPAGNELPVTLTQSVLLLVFVGLGYGVVRRLRRQ